jgi:hypothetical protein
VHSGVFFEVLLRAAWEMTKSLPVFRRSYLSLPPMSHLAFPLPKRIRVKNTLGYTSKENQREEYVILPKRIRKKNKSYFQRESERRIGYTSKENQREE